MNGEPQVETERSTAQDLEYPITPNVLNNATLEYLNGKREVAEALVANIIRLIGDDPQREGLLETPARVVRSWAELFSGYHTDPGKHVKVFSATYDQVVAVKNIDYFSMCEHHMLPFFGKVAIAYLPNGQGKVLGVSKLARIVEVFSRRLQIQEQMTQQIAEAVSDAVKPKGVAVIVDGTHLCMMARGVKQQHAGMTTSCLLGVFREKPEARAEILTLMR
jgi:GTP cyclohydrolase I